MVVFTLTPQMLVYIKNISKDSEYRSDVTELASNIEKCKEYEMDVQVKELFILLVRLLLKMTSALNKKIEKLSFGDKKAYEIYKSIYYKIIELGKLLATNNNCNSHVIWKREVKKMMGDKQFFVVNNKYDCDPIERDCEISKLLVDYYENNCYSDIYYHINYYHNDCYQNNCYQNETFAQTYAQLLLFTINFLITGIQTRYGLIIETENC